MRLRHLRSFKKPTGKGIALACLRGLAGTLPLGLASIANAQALLVTPRVELQERYSDNATLSSSAKQTELITQVSPGISIRSQTGKIRGSLDYSLRALQYAHGTSGNQLQNALNAAFAVEAVENWAFVDISSTIGQQSISAFGTRSSDATSRNSNSTETASFQLSPYIRGTLGGAVAYQARLQYQAVRAQSASASDSTTRSVSANLSDASGGALRWSFDANSSRTSYSLGRATDTRQLRGRLTYAWTPQATTWISVLNDSNNFTTAGQSRLATAGAGFDWIISPRTSVAGAIERRSFGHSHSFNFSHRTGLTSWRFSDSQDVTTNPTAVGLSAIGTLSDLMDRQLQAIEPDPLRRAELVSSYLQANGYDPAAQVLGNFLSSSVSVQHRQEISVALIGTRSSMSLGYSRSANRKLDTLTTALDDFSTAEMIRQSGWTLGFSHRLTPDSSVTLAASRQSTDGSGGVSGTSLRSVDLVMSSRLGRLTTASIGARRVLFDSSTSPYSENSITGTLRVQF